MVDGLNALVEAGDGALSGDALTRSAVMLAVPRR